MSCSQESKVVSQESRRKKTPQTCNFHPGAEVVLHPGGNSARSASNLAASRKALKKQRYVSFNETGVIRLTPSVPREDPSKPRCLHHAGWLRRKIGMTANLFSSNVE